ncbi:extracellular solute-binding protein 3 [Tanacetum coccineum]
MMRVNVHDKSNHTRRSIQEQQADVCAGRCSHKFNLFLLLLVVDIVYLLFSLTMLILGAFGICLSTQGIIGPTWNIAKQGKSPCPTLYVWVPKKTSFTEFVKVNQQSEVEGGFSIAIFCYALTLLPYNVRPIFKPFIGEKGQSDSTYDQLLRHIGGKTCEAAAGDVTMRRARAEFVSFTIPYLNADLYMLVLGKHDLHQTLWTFFKPFTTRLWITLVFACFLTGVTFAFLEFREHNPEFATPFYRQLVMVIWFPISTFFLHEGRIRNKFSKVVLVMWLSMVFIVLQIFTATLSSWLTLDQLRPPLSTLENVGYQNGSFIKDFIIHRYNSSGMRITPLNSVEEYKNALFSGGVDAFPNESPILQPFSMAVLNVTESDIVMEMKKKYLGLSDLSTHSEPNQAHPQSLDVQSFTGLFVFMGIVIIAAIVSSEIAIMQRKNKINVEKKQKEEDTILVENFLIFMTVAAVISSDMSITRRNNRIRDEEG